jgi:molybdopterin molybdotransferase
MDGIAVRKTQVQDTVILAGTRFSGPISDVLDSPDTSAIRIMTGAKVPPWADGIIPVEQTTSRKGYKELGLESDVVCLNPRGWVDGQHIRRAGTDFKKGDLIFKSHLTLNPSRLMVLASLGIDPVPVSVHPRVWLAVTGDELKQPGEPIQDGEIYDSSSVFLSTAFKMLGIPLERHCRLADQPDELRRVWGEWLSSPGPSVLITTGGVSAGERDYLPEVATQLGMDIHFHKVAIRPGKPMVFASKGGSHFWLGAPGNAISTLVAWMFFIRPFLSHVWRFPELPRHRCFLHEDCPKPEGLQTFYRGYSDGQAVVIAPNQGSASMANLVSSNVVAVLPEAPSVISKGSLVTCVPLGA